MVSVEIIRQREQYLTPLAWVLSTDVKNYGYGPVFQGGYEMHIPHPGDAPFFYGGMSHFENPQNSFLPQDCSDCIFISNLPKNVQKEQLVDLFSQAGKIKTSKGL